MAPRSRTPAPDPSLEGTHITATPLADRPDPVATGSELSAELAAVWSDVATVAPSFAYRLHEDKRRHRLIRRFGVNHPVWLVNQKDAGYRFAARHGVEAPRQYGMFDDVRQLRPDELPDRFLLKPRSGSTNRGVHALARDGDSLLDLLSNEPVRLVEVARSYESLVAEGLISRQVGVEELLLHPVEALTVPDDWKLYTFYDRVALIMQRRLNRSRAPADWHFKLWTPGWDDVGPVKFADRYQPGLPPPTDGDTLLDAAHRLGSVLRLPFVRIDLYDTSRGVVFGELTPHPGPPEVFEPEIDQQLGREWELAEARLLAERIGHGYGDQMRV